MSSNSGTDPCAGCSNEWVILEAECSDENDPPEDVPDYDAATDISELLDNSEVEQGNTLELFSLQENRESQRQVLELKRKYVRRREDQKVLCDLSPRWNVLRNSPDKKKVKRRHINPEGDSGIQLSFSLDNEVTTADENLPEAVQVEGYGWELTNESGGQGGRTEEESISMLTRDILRSNNRRVTLLAKFKALTDVSFTDITRPFKSDKTCCTEWVIGAFGVPELLYESTKTLLRGHCQYMHLHHFAGNAGLVLLMLVEFNTGKNRVTVKKLLQSILGISEALVLAEPPRRRSVAAAVYWYKLGLTTTSYIQGETPQWVKQQISISHQTAEDVAFDLGTMVQWAYDNEMVEECQIAYHYALLAEEDKNAAAWLASPAQARYVRDCHTMVQHYRRAQMLNMSISTWIHQRISRVKQPGDWKNIAKFLRYQSVDFISFMNTFKVFLKGVPKKNCILIHGPPNCGKTYFCMSLVSFLGGNVLSFVNSRSQFWLQPVADAKIVLLDDATKPCLDYFDTFLRNAIDGNTICVDRKHRAPVQSKCPPMLVTSNIDIHTDHCWRFLYSRITCIKFALEMPFNDDGSPVFALTDESWASFFTRLWTHLELSDQEDEGEDGNPTQTFRCGARRNDGSV
ncbi:E1 [Trichechus manatus latirostris papillomavirus 3]|uniref:Replication protein E1 n=1 Tax=Trichechus manatus latirostris papillomavirus 3 TaxID=2848316 RepID=A0A0F6TNZ5_9PAPI|nr:E1 [Trichechus manatus latirostris papillomavirus 3]AKE50898.1 E1 [Trichechus manatus latirostris papillomavirus 3]